MSSDEKLSSSTRSSVSSADELPSAVQEKLTINNDDDAAANSEPKPRFIAPKIQENPNGWGPSGLPKNFQNLPFQFFNKSDRIGRVADWTGQTYRDDRRFGSKIFSIFGYCSIEFCFSNLLLGFCSFFKLK